MICLGTKAETLLSLAPRLLHAKVLPQVAWTVGEWRADRHAVLARVRDADFATMIVRSSALAEDSRTESLAGHFVSVPNVTNDGLAEAIDRVIGSYAGREEPLDQVLVQPMLSGVTLSGVAFTRDPSTGGHYYVVSYDASGATDSVTAGTSVSETFYWFVGAERPRDPRLARVVDLLAELEALTGIEALDVELAFANDALYLLQCRPLVGVAIGDREAEAKALAAIEARVRRQNRPHPHLLGERTVYGVMPDWNPAEIVGVRPRPLALSLYRELVTDSIWAYQRDNYGYRNLRSFPLILDFFGLPYVDVRVSFNSFVPSDVPAPLAEKLLNYYVGELIASPQSHDKVEFDIIFTCSTFDLPERMERLAGHGFDGEERAALAESLRKLTCRIIHPETGLWRKDASKVERLEARYEAIRGSDLDPLAKIYWLVEDCKRYGTLPFAGLARAGFIAVQMLRSLVARGVLSQTEYDRFLGSLDTVSSQMSRDLGELSSAAFLRRYGHLRPGTYDILSARYDAAPELYFEPGHQPETHARESFGLTLGQYREVGKLLKAHGLGDDVLGLFDFIKGAVEGREHSKFVFTRSLSMVIESVAALGAEHGFSREDCAYVSIGPLLETTVSGGEPREVLARSIEHGRARHALTRQLVLPPLIVDAKDVWQFVLPAGEPSFITQRRAIGHRVGVEDPRARLAGGIMFIPSADPGFDWIFSHGIAGFVTQFGGTNSHMAIRAGELGIPAVIGAGEVWYRRWAGAARLELDCQNRTVRLL